jgi:hypothetical protein
MYDQISGRMSQAAYDAARGRARRAQVWSRFRGEPNGLFSLREVSATVEVGAQRHAGVRTVKIDRIRGSQGRCKDFDRDFNPLQDHTASRWKNIARARDQGKALPPVNLVKVGDVYFVLDGHHRVSVARANGQVDIEANVTEWDVQGTLPWEKAVGAANGSGVVRLFRHIAQTGAQSFSRALTGVRSVVPA